MIGRRLGRFVIESELGRGGMATVWKARDELLQRAVALKILNHDLAAAPKVRRRFLREAMHSARLDHPSIVVVFDSSECDGFAYIALAHIDGRTVHQLVCERLLPLREAIRIVLAASDAIAYAHAEGVIHRDISSRNIMVAKDGRVVILDFGLSRAKWESRLSSSNHPMGTVAYMSPEAIRGHADERSDVYGLGVVLYEALTGGLPFPADQAQTVMFRVLNEEPISPRDRRPDIPESLAAIVLKAIARDPEDRFQSATELSEALRALTIAEERVAEAPPMRRLSTVMHCVPDSEGQTAPVLPDPLYVGVLSFSHPDVDPDDSARRLSESLTPTLRSALSNAGARVVRVPLEDSSPSNLRNAGVQLGANVLIQGNVRRAGARLRVTYGIVDSWRGLDLRGDRIDGSVFQPFDLEDAVVKSVLTALGLAPVQSPTTRPKDPAAEEHYLQAVAHLRHHDQEAAVDAAIRLLENLIASEGAVARYFATLARAFLFKHQVTHQRIWESKAAVACERATDLDPNAPETRLGIGWLRLFAGQHIAALEEFSRLPGLIEAELGTARVLTELGKHSEAAALAADLANRHSDDARCYSMLGWIHLRAAHYPEALFSYQKAASLTPDSAHAALCLGNALFRLDRFEDAADAYRHSIAIQPTDEAYSNLGVACYYLGQDVDAIRAFRKATDLAPLDPLRWGNLGNACRWVDGHETESRSALERGVALIRDRLDRNSAVAEWWAWLAGWQATLGVHHEAAAAMKTALERGPRDLECMKEAVRVYHQLGDRQECLRWLRAARAAGAEAGEFRHSRELAPLRRDPEFMRLLDPLPPERSGQDGDQHRGDGEAA